MITKIDSLEIRDVNYTTDIVRVGVKLTIPGLEDGIGSHEGVLYFRLEDEDCDCFPLSANPFNMWFIRSVLLSKDTYDIVSEINGLGKMVAKEYRRKIEDNRLCIRNMRIDHPHNTILLDISFGKYDEFLNVKVYLDVNSHVYFSRELIDFVHEAVTKNDFIIDTFKDVFDEITTDVLEFINDERSWEVMVGND